MNSFNKRVYEMLVRVLAFWTTYRDLIGKDSLADQLFQQLDAACQKLAKHGTLQASGKAAVRLSAGERAAARQSLVNQLETICRTAVGMGLKQFWMPRERSDQAFVQAGETFPERLMPLKKQFVENHLPENFIENLVAATETLNRSLKDEAFSMGKQLAATSTIDQVQSEALSTLSRLDPILENQLSGNPPVRSVWDSARRVERARLSAKPPQKGQPKVPPSPPPPHPSAEHPASNHT